MKYIKYFEDIRDEYPDMFPPRKPEDKPQSIPGLWIGNIDPNDDDKYRISDEDYKEDRKYSDRERYKKFIKITKDRNFEENEDTIIINLNRLSQDFSMHVMNSRKHLTSFLKNELIGKYISDGYMDIVKDIPYEGIIEDLIIKYYDDYLMVLNLKLKDKILSEDNCSCDSIITIDKLKSAANKFNI